MVIMFFKLMEGIFSLAILFSARWGYALMPQCRLDGAGNISVFCEDGRKTGHVLSFASASRDAVDRWFAS